MTRGASLSGDGVAMAASDEPATSGVSGRHRSMNEAISGASKLNHVNRSARGTLARSLSPSTNRATGSSPAARSLKK
jgi:hypothetical protein